MKFSLNYLFFKWKPPYLDKGRTPHGQTTWGLMHNVCTNCRNRLQLYYAIDDNYKFVKR
jgi:hypothetical protein